jgi:predicted lysophospholipase L1 biosynthesis ABC-type transport system permease subunit
VPVTFLILAFLLCLTVWAFFRYSPPGVPSKRLATVNATAVVFAIVLAAIACDWMLRAAAAEPRSRGLSWSLALMAGSSIFMTVIALGGTIRNFLLFPLRTRSCDTNKPHEMIAP